MNQIFKYYFILGVLSLLLGGLFTVIYPTAEEECVSDPYECPNEPHRWEVIFIPKKGEPKQFIFFSFIEIVNLEKNLRPLGIVIFRDGTKPAKWRKL
jgi:hypothetical protein